MLEALSGNYRKVDALKANYIGCILIYTLGSATIKRWVYGSGATESKVSVVSDHRAYFIFSKYEVGR